VLVIDRTELTYQLQRAAATSKARRCSTLSNDRFDVSLASLIAARAADGAQPPRRRPPARRRGPSCTRVRRKRRDAAPEGVRYSGILPTQMSLNITQSPIRL
jgi:hypothetical protein